ncbi:MAG: class I SAM-dependent rRNA methyltransferase, partial [Bacteroidetes bacterium]
AFARAWRTRTALGLVADPLTNAFRLVHAAGDLLPGLIVDLYGATAVVQCHSWGMYLEREAIVQGLRDVLGPEHLQAVYLKSRSTLARRFREELSDGYLFGDGDGTLTVVENGHQFEVNLVTGQKTGFFLDQRDNRQLLTRYAEGARILNTFCYSGGFSIYALAAKAAQVDSVDVSAKAIALCERNVILNKLPSDRHRAITSEVLPFLKAADAYDIVIVDPPAYAKSFAKRHQAVQGYKRLNLAAMERVRPGGLLFTFSCSQVVDRQLFQDTIVAAGLETGRSARVLHQLTQGPDHPVNLFQPEGSYLKGLVVQLD